jgi:two-component system response regulator DesR
MVGAGIAPLRILVVDDDRLVRTAMRRSLSRLPNTLVFDFQTGRDAVAACAKNPFDVGVFDLMMPGMDGVEVAAQVRVIIPAIRLVFVTADLSGALADRARAMNPVAVFPKPWPLPELLATVRGA